MASPFDSFDSAKKAFSDTRNSIRYNALTEIERAIRNGKYKCTVDGELYDDLRKELDKAGYQVYNHSSHNWFEISWLNPKDEHPFNQ